MSVSAFLGRQPVLNRNQQLIGYELLFRESETSTEIGRHAELDADTEVLVERLAVAAVSEAAPHPHEPVDAFIDKYRIKDAALDKLALIVRAADCSAPHLAKEAAGLLAGGAVGVADFPAL